MKQIAAQLWSIWHSKGDLTIWKGMDYQLLLLPLTGMHP